MQHSKTVKRALKFILFIAIFMGLMILLDAAFELDETKTEEMLTAYSQTDDISTVFVGNSAGEMLDAAVYEELSGEPAFNMCTPSQGLSVSLKNIKLARSHHMIKKAVLLMTPDMVDTESYDAIDHLYDRTVDSSSPFYIRIRNDLKRDWEKAFADTSLGSEKTVNVWIPWENETIHGFENIRSNLSRRLKRALAHEPLGYRIAFDLNTARYETAQNDPSDEDEAVFDEDLAAMEELDIPEGMLGSDKVRLLSDMCRFCSDNGIDLTVIVTPHRPDYYGRYEGFREDNARLSAFLNDLISKRGFMYYNTEDDPRLHEILPDLYFYDWEHISDEYKGQATRYLYDVISSLK